MWLACLPTTCIRRCLLPCPRATNLGIIPIGYRGLELPRESAGPLGGSELNPCGSQEGSRSKRILILFDMGCFTYIPVRGRLRHAWCSRPLVALFAFGSGPVSGGSGSRVVQGNNCVRFFCSSSELLSKSVVGVFLPFSLGRPFPSFFLLCALAGGAPAPDGASGPRLERVYLY